jgi:hypothetical protein
MELNQGIAEIQHLGDTKDYVFNFSSTSSSSHHVSLDGYQSSVSSGLSVRPIISLEYSSDGTAAHEARHAFQYITAGVRTGVMRFSSKNDYKLAFMGLPASKMGETSAYRLQYAVQKSSLPIPARNINAINPLWIKSIPGNPYGY